MTTLRLTLAFALLACGPGASEEASDPVEPAAGSGAETSVEPAADEPAGRICAESPEAFAEALASVFDGYVAPADRAAMEAPVEWSPSLRAWNELQAERLHVAEGEDPARLGGRYHAWGIGLPAERLELLRAGPFALHESGEQLILQAGPEGDPATLSVAVAREAGCLRLDDT